MRRLQTPKLESLFCGALVLFGFGLGVRPIADNSMLTHLRTGIDMARGAGIPRVDPYSFTAAGEPWVVQSWLAELTYGWAYRIGGFRLVVIEQALLMGVLAWLITRLARTGASLRTALAAGVAVGLGGVYWSPRPLLFGLICFALTVLIVERRLTPWLLLPVVWVWVNSHGSFPLGLLWLGARAVGEYRDWRTWPRETTGYVWGFLGGLVVAAVNPLGARLITFPLTVLDKTEAFRDITEWRSPDFQTFLGRVVLFFLLVALALLVRNRMSWRDTLPVVLFIGAGLLSVRNVAPAAIVLAPVLARALRPSAEDLRPAARGVARVNRVFLAAIAAGFAVFALSTMVGEPLELDSYPDEAVTYLDDQGFFEGDGRLAHQDTVGNYLIFRFGRDASVFVDDRYDMYPAEVSEDFTTLLRLREESLDLLDEYGVDAVLWADNAGLATLLGTSPEWDEVYRDDDWVVFERAGPPTPTRR